MRHCKPEQWTHCKATTAEKQVTMNKSNTGQLSPSALSFSKALSFCRRPSILTPPDGGYWQSNAEGGGENTPPISYSAAVENGAPRVVHHSHATTCGCHVVHHPVVATHRHCRETVPCESADANVVPVGMLRRWPALIECPACHEVGATNIRYKTDKATQ